MYRIYSKFKKLQLNYFLQLDISSIRLQSRKENSGQCSRGSPTRKEGGHEPLSDVVLQGEQSEVGVQHIVRIRCSACCVLCQEDQYTMFMHIA